jgi:hypothetical protein
MNIQQNKDRLIIDHDEHYIPILKTATGKVQVIASFSLAKLGVRSGERLERLVDFIRRNNQGAARRSHNGESVGVSHRLTAQIVYLAYWENYPLEFRIESEADIVIRACFPQQPELTITLDVFKNKMDPCSEIQGWWSFLCEIIAAHADIWNIPLVVDESIYCDLMPGDFPRVLVDIVAEREISKEMCGAVGAARFLHKRTKVNHAATIS